MFNLTLDQLRGVMPGLALAQASRYLPYLQAAMTEFGIVTRLRACAFLSQVAHESSDLKYQAEIWGPTPAQKRYDTRTDLGNTPDADGDGYKYRGRGALQLTGAGNYRSVGKALGVDLFADPDRADDVDVSFRIAGYYWDKHNLNDVADQLTGVADTNEVRVYTKITRAINGGTNGLADRIARYSRALKAIPVDTSLDRPVMPNRTPTRPAETIRESEQLTAPAATTAPVKDVADVKDHDKFQALVQDDAMRAKAAGMLPGAWRFVARPLLLLKGAAEAHSLLAISSVVLVVALLIVLGFLHRKDLKRIARWCEDQARRRFFKQ